MQSNDLSGAPPSSRAQPALEGVSAFLAEMLTMGYELGLLQQETFFEIIPPRILMNALSGYDLLRGNILHDLRYRDEPLAYDLSAEACGEILEMIMVLRLKKAGDVLKVMTPERCVRCLNHKLLWSAITARPFWKGVRKNVDPEVVKAERHLLLCLAFSSLKHGLITYTDIVDGIGVRKLRKMLLPWKQIELLERMRDYDRATVTVDRVMVEAVTIKTIVSMIPKVFWEKVVNPKIEVAYDLWSMRPPESTYPADDEGPSSEYSLIYGRR